MSGKSKSSDNYISPKGGYWSLYFFLSACLAVYGPKGANGESPGCKPWVICHQRDGAPTGRTEADCGGNRMTARGRIREEKSHLPAAWFPCARILRQKWEFTKL